MTITDHDMAPPAPPSDPRDRAHLVPHRWLVLMTILAALPTILLLPTKIGSAVRSVRHVLPVDDAPSSREQVTVRPVGPWGQLEYTRITIAPPLEFIAELQHQATVFWQFPGMSISELTVLINSAPMDAADRAKIIELAKVDASIAGVTVAPPADLVSRLTPAARAVIYNKLAMSPLNVAQNEAFRFAGPIDEWFFRAGLSHSSIDVIEPLLYRNGNYHFFADLPLVFQRIADETERTKVVQTLARESSLIVKLKLEDFADIDKLVAYWGKGGRAKDIRPLLESLERVPGDVWVDISHLLPPFARRRLYTYPHPDTVKGDRDCHWTCLNFFAEEPQDWPADEKIHKILDEFYPVYGNFQFGDVVLFVDDNNDVFHSAVYIADDILFTKNGPRSSRPWIFSRLEDLKDFYPRDSRVSLRYFRRKGM